MRPCSTSMVMLNKRQRKHSECSTFSLQKIPWKAFARDFNGWQQGEPPNAIHLILLGMTDPTNPDTDDDGMYDGFEYWFTAWDFE